MNITVPPSKSLTNRALICAALAGSKSALKNILQSDDTKYMQQGLRKLLSLKAISYKLKTIYCGNSGTTVRFLAAMAATLPHTTIITGDKRMQLRPIQDLLNALNQLGARTSSIKRNGCPPIHIQGPLIGGTCTVKGSISSQYLSALLLAAPYAKHDVTIKVSGPLLSKPYVDMTIDVMKKFGVMVQRNGYKTFYIKAGKGYRSTTYTIEGDASSATYFWGLNALFNANITVTNISKNSKQADARFPSLIKKMGVSVPLKPIGRINLADMPDAALTVATLCAFAPLSGGKSVLTGLSNLKEKESDRLLVMATELRKIGATVRQKRDGWEIIGAPEKLHGATIKTYDDHRIAMCFGMAQTVIPDIKIKHPSCVKKTYPAFWQDLARVKSSAFAKASADRSAFVRPALRGKQLSTINCNLILTGMRGTGKTKLGKLIAKKLRRRFFDIDRLIEQKAKMRISAIVKKYGWKHFRALEKRVTASLRYMTNAVISTGGGTLLNPTNTAHLKIHGVVILLQDTIANLQGRIAKSRKRPSLTGKTDAISELKTVWEKRKKRYYAVADYVIQRTDFKKDIRKIVKIIR